MSFPGICLSLPKLGNILLWKYMEMRNVTINERTNKLKNTMIKLVNLINLCVFFSF